MTERLLALTGADNFRDLGGYRTDDGRRVRWRRLFRSASLQELTDDDVAVLRDEVGLRVMIDLRAPSEVAREGSGPLRRAGVRYLNVPVIREHAGYRYEVPDRVDLGAQYFEIAEDAGPSLAAIFELLAETDGTPAVLHCAAGKDRTGIASALVLGVLGVPPADLAEDYALSEPHMAAVRARLRRLPSYGDRVDRVPHEVWSAAAVNMQDLLQRIDQHYGGLRQWARAQGVADRIVDALEDRLLEEV